MVDDECANLELDENVQLQIETLDKFQNVVQLDHPIILDQVNICELTANVLASKSVKQSVIQELAIPKLRAVLTAIGRSDYKGRSRRIIATAIEAFVREKCTCLI